MKSCGYMKEVHWCCLHCMWCAWQGNYWQKRWGYYGSTIWKGIQNKQKFCIIWNFSTTDKATKGPPCAPHLRCDYTCLRIGVQNESGLYKTNEPQLYYVWHCPPAHTNSPIQYLIAWRHRPCTLILRPPDLKVSVQEGAPKANHTLCIVDQLP